MSWAEIAGQKQSLCRSTKGLNSEFSFSKTGCHTKIKEPNLTNYSTIVGDRIVRFIQCFTVVETKQLPFRSFPFISFSHISDYSWEIVNILTYLTKNTTNQLIFRCLTIWLNEVCTNNHFIFWLQIIFLFSFHNQR